MAASKKNKPKAKKKGGRRGLKVLLVFLLITGLTAVIFVSVNQLQKALTLAKTVEVQPNATFGGPGTQVGAFQQPWALAVDSKGDLVASDFSAHRIQKFDPSGKLLFSIGKEGKGPGEFNQPSGIYIGEDDDIYVCDTFNYRIQKFDSKGHFLKSWEHSFYGPKGIMGNGQGKIYVVDTGNHKVQVFDKDGDFLKEWGGNGSEAGKFKEPIGGVVDAQGFVYVADTDNLRVQKFDPEGKPLASFKIQTWKGKNYETPYLALGGGFLWVTNTSEGSVLKFTLQGKLAAIYKAKGGGFSDPSGVAVGLDGQVYVTERNTGKIQRFMPPAAPASR
ncbi:MAG TPA: NHL repeat-containing protein [bacterium]|nr:NHL repeat-containing protein [bacterium]